MALEPRGAMKPPQRIDRLRERLQLLGQSAQPHPILSVVRRFRAEPYVALLAQDERQLQVKPEQGIPR